MRALPGSVALGLALMVATSAGAEACRATGVALDFGRWPIGSRVESPEFTPQRAARCRLNEGCSIIDKDGVRHGAEAYPGEPSVIARKTLSGPALNAYSARIYGWRLGDTVAAAQAKFRRATGKTLDGGVNDTGEIFLHDVCARNRFGEYQFYASFGKTGRLKELITRIDTPYD